jgi:hypothetical protein
MADALAIYLKSAGARETAGKLLKKSGAPLTRHYFSKTISRAMNTRVYQQFPERPHSRGSADPIYALASDI